MSENGSNRPRSALADGADKLAKLARTVREQQIADTLGAPRFPVSDVYSMSPDEAWSKQYMSQGIGPVPECTAAGGFCPMPFTAAQLQKVAASAPVKPQVSATVVHVAAPEPVPAAASPAQPAQIGQTIGKPYKRRGWFSRTP